MSLITSPETLPKGGSPSGSGGWVLNVSFGGIQLNPLHLGAFFRNPAGVPLCLHLWGSQGKFSDKRTVPRSILVPGDLSGRPRCSPRTPRMPSGEGAASAVWRRPGVERASPLSRHRARRAWRGLTRSPAAEPLWPRPQDLALQALPGRLVGSPCRPGPPLYHGGVASPTQWTRV